MVDVFISYSRTDLAAVRLLAGTLEDDGYDVWWDADLPPHLSYGDVITAKIKTAKAAIVVWSEASVSSEWVRAEADMARNQKKLVQTSLDNVMPPLPFNQIQYAELGGWAGEPDHPGWRKVKASLAELCGKDRQDEPRPARRTSPQPAPIPHAAPKWPLFAGLGVGSLALAVAGWMVMRSPERAPTLVSPERAGPAESPVPASEAAPAHSAPAPQSAPAPPAAPAPAVSSSDGMVFPDSSQRPLTERDVAGLDSATLEIARNEIFARKGRRFARADLRRHFAQFDWYHPVTDEVTLNATEQRNVDFLRRAEARLGP